MFEKYFIRTRKREIVYNRYVIFYYLSKVKKMTLKNIGNKSGYDHATVIHAIKKVDEMLHRDRYFMEVTHNVGNKLMPELWKQPKEIEDQDLSRKINIQLQRMGVDASDKYAICGQIGDRIFTVDGFKKFINDLTC